MDGTDTPAARMQPHAAPAHSVSLGIPPSPYVPERRLPPIEGLAIPPSCPPTPLPASWHLAPEAGSRPGSALPFRGGELPGGAAAAPNGRKRAPPPTLRGGQLHKRVREAGPVYVHTGPLSALPTVSAAPSASASVGSGAQQHGSGGAAPSLGRSATTSPAVLAGRTPVRPSSHTRVCSASAPTPTHGGGYLQASLDPAPFGLGGAAVAGAAMTTPAMAVFRRNAYPGTGGLGKENSDGTVLGPLDTCGAPAGSPVVPLAAQATPLGRPATPFRPIDARGEHKVLACSASGRCFLPGPDFGRSATAAAAAVPGLHGMTGPWQASSSAAPSASMSPAGSLSETSPTPAGVFGSIEGILRESRRAGDQFARQVLFRRLATMLGDNWPPSAHPELPPSLGMAMVEQQRPPVLQPPFQDHGAAINELLVQPDQVTIPASLAAPAEVQPWRSDTGPGLLPPPARALDGWTAELDTLASGSWALGQPPAAFSAAAPPSSAPTATSPVRVPLCRRPGAPRKSPRHAARRIAMARYYGQGNLVRRLDMGPTSGAAAEAAAAPDLSGLGDLRDLLSPHLTLEAATPVTTRS